MHWVEEGNFPRQARQIATLFGVHKEGEDNRRTWQMVKRHGIIGAVERTVSRETETVGYTALLEAGLEDYAFEAVVVRYRELFSSEAVRHSQARVRDWKERR
jgi:hypothetical protein